MAWSDEARSAAAEARAAHQQGTNNAVPHAAGSADPQSAAHQSWARGFSEWATRNAFGPSTVNGQAMREHMLANNAEVQAAHARVQEAQAKVNETAMANPYRPTPVEHTKALSDAQSHMRRVVGAARQAMKGF